jgi:hypothetical protein
MAAGSAFFLGLAIKYREQGPFAIAFLVLYAAITASSATLAFVGFATRQGWVGWPLGLLMLTFAGVPFLARLFSRTTE